MVKLKLRLVVATSLTVLGFLALTAWQNNVEEQPLIKKRTIDVIQTQKPDYHFEGFQDDYIENQNNLNHDEDPPRYIHLEGGRNYSSRERQMWFLERYRLDWGYRLNESPWKLAESWTTSRKFHPDSAPEMGAILRMMNKANITKADVGHRGTQLKLLLTLYGGQRVAFKPKWYERDYIVPGLPYDGRDRHNAEIASFHLNRILGYHRVPLTVGRVVDLEQEIMPVSTTRLLETFFVNGSNLCFYGVCRYCKGKEDGVCANGAKLEGTLSLWMAKKWQFQQRRHPYQRSYRDGIQAVWETNRTYCDSVKQSERYSTGPGLLDIIDASVFDYLIGNADRHHYEVIKNEEDGMLVMFDNAKSFGNPHHDERSILAPVYQCCIIRQSTYERLQLLGSGVLSKVLSKILAHDPIAPILTDLHYEALDRRLLGIYNAVDTCIAKHGSSNVLMTDDYS